MLIHLFPLYWITVTLCTLAYLNLHSVSVTDGSKFSSQIVNRNQ